MVTMVVIVSLWGCRRFNNSYILCIIVVIPEAGLFLGKVLIICYLPGLVFISGVNMWLGLVFGLSLSVLVYWQVFEIYKIDVRVDYVSFIIYNYFKV